MELSNPDTEQPDQERDRYELRLMRRDLPTDGERL